MPDLSRIGEREKLKPKAGDEPHWQRLRQGVYLGFREACQGIAMNLLARVMPENHINKTMVKNGIIAFTILVSWGAIVLNAPVLSFSSICSPIFGLVGCLIPAYLVYQVPFLQHYKGWALRIIIFTGVLLCVSPFLAFS